MYSVFSAEGFDMNDTKLEFTVQHPSVEASLTFQAHQQAAETQPWGLRLSTQYFLIRKKWQTDLLVQLTDHLQNVLCSNVKSQGPPAQFNARYLGS
ncbi:uncharacterized protein V6R79_008950 [Siganus canaliculatus]